MEAALGARWEESQIAKVSLEMFYRPAEVLSVPKATDCMLDKSLIDLGMQVVRDEVLMLSVETSNRMQRDSRWTEV